MTDLVLAIGVFVATHLFSAWPAPRARLVGAIGRRAYMILYSLLSLGLVVWIGHAYDSAPYIEFMPPLPGARWAPVGVMPVVCLLVAAGMSSPNPFSLGLSAKNYDPGRPGIVGVTRHPVIWGMALWAASHLLANTDAAGALLFGLLLALGLTGPGSLDRKRRKTLGDEAWRRLRADTGRTSMGRALVQTGVWRWLAAAVLYAALLGAHEAVIGVSALPA